VVAIVNPTGPTSIDKIALLDAATLRSPRMFDANPRISKGVESEQILSFDWSPDGKKLGILRGHTDSDVVLLQESKP
jgi:hypothetical protein